MFATAIAFLIRNPIARKAVLVAALLASLLYINKLSINHAYEQGRIEGGQQAWVQAEEASKTVWEAAQSDIRRQYDEIAKKASAVSMERREFDKQHAVSQAKHEAALKSTQEAVKVTEEQIQAAPVEVSDGLPPKEVLINALTQYRDAVEVLNQTIDYLEAEHQKNLNIMNKEIAERGEEIDVLKADLAQTHKQLDFYQQAFHEVTKKRGGFWHKVKRVVTLGIAR